LYGAELLPSAEIFFYEACFPVSNVSKCQRCSRPPGEIEIPLEGTELRSHMVSICQHILQESICAPEGAEYDRRCNADDENEEILDAMVYINGPKTLETLCVPMSEFTENDEHGDHDQGKITMQAMEYDENPEMLGLAEKELQCEHSAGKKIFSFVFRFAVSIALLFWIFKSVDLSIFKEVIVSPNVIPIVAMIGSSLVFLFLGAVKLWILFRSFSPINLRLFTGYFFLAGSVGSLAPAIFGDFTLIGLAKDSQIPVHKSVSAILVDRFITMVIALFIFTPFTLIFILPVKPVFILVLMLTLLALLGCVMWISRRIAPFLFAKFLVTKRFWESFSMYFKGDRTKLYANIFISIVRGIVSGVTLIFALMAANVSPPFIPTICISNSLSILTHIPVSLSGLGVFEGSGLILFETLGLNKEQVLAGLLYHRIYIICWAILTSVVLTLLFAIRKYSGNRDIHK